ncbi:MAG TPA: DUF1648 domain-containing protein [Terracidiphilus sp.]|nr:DUF1648 domain-containing protein [Terracidiphilus sp.]
MRATLQLAALAALVAMWALTAWAVAGSHPLPARIPTHFDLAGNPNGWGTPGMLWLLPVIATVIVGLMSLVARYPRSFNYPVRVTPVTRPRLEAISLDMIARLCMELAGLMLWIQYAIIQAARSGRNSLSPLIVPIAILVVLATVGWHIRAMIVAARRPAV